MTDQQSPGTPPPKDWQTSVDVNGLLAHPEVRGMILAVSGQRPGGMTGEQFLDAAQPIMSAVGAGGVKLKKVAEVAQPLYARMGVKSGKTDTCGFRYPTGLTIAAALCSLSSRNQHLKDVEQGEDGCLLRADIPSSLYSFAGELLITLERHPDGTLVNGAVTIPGQAFDWGHSKRVLKHLFADMGQQLRAS